MRFSQRLCFVLLGVSFLLGGPSSMPQANQVQMSLDLSTPVLLAGKKQNSYLKIALTGFELKNAQRTPVNVAIVLDKSGSMAGAKIRRAREAAIMAMDRLDPNDIVSIISYDASVQVRVPATKLTDRKLVRAAIEQISASGSTALFAGVSQGADELRKFLDINRVNRIILLSDGLANIGPSTPAELAALGSSLGKEGIAVSTIGLGLGYNEDLMSGLALQSDGNHAFVENATDLARTFQQEFGDVLSVVAQEVEVTIHCPPGVRPVRALGRQADIHGQTIRAALNQLYSHQEKYLLLELEIDSGEAGHTREIAQVEVSYANMQTHATDRLTGTVSARFSQSVQQVADKLDAEVASAAVEQIAVEQNKAAVSLRDAGKIEEARAVLRSNTAYLAQEAKKLKSARLSELKKSNEMDAEGLEANDWGRQRKAMRKEQYKSSTQQSY